MTELFLPSISPSKLSTLSMPNRLALIDEAIALPKGLSSADKSINILYEFGLYQVGVQTPGKEYFSTKLTNKITRQLGNNKNDMTPTIFQDGKIVEKPGSFEAIFKQFLLLMYAPESLRSLGTLIVRNAFALDHAYDLSGKLRYSPPKEIVSIIRTKLPDEFPEPIEVFLAYLEVIALNEDVKYHTLGYDLKKGVGRINNLLSYANIISLILKKNEVPLVEFLSEFMEFAGKITRNRGVFPISIKRALECFPLLNVPNSYMF